MRAFIYLLVPVFLLALIARVASPATFEPNSIDGEQLISVQPREIGQLTIPVGGFCLLQSGPPVDGSTTCNGISGLCRIDTLTDVAYYCEDVATKDWTAFSGGGGGASISATGTQLLYRAGASEAGGLAGSSYGGDVLDLGTSTQLKTDRLQLGTGGCIEKVPGQTAFYINQNCNDDTVDPDLGDWVIDMVNVDAVVDISTMNQAQGMAALAKSIHPYTKATPTDSWRTVIWTGQSSWTLNNMKGYGTSDKTRVGVLIAPTTNTLDGNGLPEIDCTRDLAAGRLRIIMVDLEIDAVETAQDSLSRLISFGARDICGWKNAAPDTDADGEISGSVEVVGNFRSFGTDLTDSWQSGRIPFPVTITGYSTKTFNPVAFSGATQMNTNDFSMELNCGGTSNDHDDIGFYAQWYFSSSMPKIRVSSCGVGMLVPGGGGVSFENPVYAGTNLVGISDMTEYGGGLAVASDCESGTCSGTRANEYVSAYAAENALHFGRLISEGNTIANVVTWVGGWTVDAGYIHGNTADDMPLILGGGTRSDNRQICCEDPDGGGALTCDSPSVVSADSSDEWFGMFNYTGLFTYYGDVCFGPSAHKLLDVKAVSQISLRGTIADANTNFAGAWGISKCTANGVPWPCCTGAGTGSCVQPNVDVSGLVPMNGATLTPPTGYTGAWKYPTTDRVYIQNTYQPGEQGVNLVAGSGLSVTSVPIPGSYTTFTFAFAPSSITSLTLGDFNGDAPFSALRFDTGATDVRFSFPSDGVMQMTNGTELGFLNQRAVRFYDSDNTQYTGLKGYSNYTGNVDLLWRSQACSTGTVDSLRMPLTINASNEIQCSNANETISPRVAKGVDTNTSVAGVEFDFTVAEGATAHMPGGVTLCPTGEFQCACNDLAADGTFASCIGGVTGKTYTASYWGTTSDRGVPVRRNTNPMDATSLQPDECLIGAVDDASDCIAAGVPRACCTGAGAGANCAVPRIVCDDGSNDQEISIRNEGELIEITHLTIANPTSSGDEMSAEGVLRLPRWAGKMLRVDCEAYGVAGCTSATAKVCLGEDIDDDNCTTQLASLVCDTTGVSSSISQTFSAGDKISYIVTATSEGSPGDCNELEIQVHGTRN
jgi:hypothetical protein